MLDNSGVFISDFPAPHFYTVLVRTPLLSTTLKGRGRCGKRELHFETSTRFGIMIPYHNGQKTR